MEPKVFIRPVGEVNWKEIKGVAKIDGIQNEPEQGESKLAATRSWSVKCKVKHKDRKKLRSLREMFKPSTAAIKAEKLAKQAWRLADMAYREKNPIRKAYYEHIAKLKWDRAEEIRIKLQKNFEEWLSQQPCGGIVPNGGDYEKCINRDEAVFSKDELAKLAEQLKQ